MGQHSCANVESNSQWNAMYYEETLRLLSNMERLYDDTTNDLIGSMGFGGAKGFVGGERGGRQ